MTREEAFTEINGIFRDIFDDDSIVVTDTTTAADIEDWDSLEHINLIVAIEKHFKMKLSIGEIAKLKNVGEMVDLIVARSQ